LLSTLAVGLVSGVILVTLTISLAALIFRNELSSGLPLGVGLALFATLVIGVVSVFGSGLDGVVAGVQDNTAAVIAAAATAISANVAPQDAVPTVVGFMVVASALTALSLGGLGAFRLGTLVQFVPYPVVGGFLVATGILILDGARSILFTSPDGAAVLSADSMWRWIPGLAAGVLILLLARMTTGRSAMPWLIAGMIALVHLMLAVAGIDRVTAVERGWLLGASEGQSLWQPDVLSILADADWGAVAGQAVALATVVALAAVSLMIKVHALDQATGEDIDVDRELSVAGIATAAGIPAGAMPGYVHFSQTLLLRNLAGPRRGPALVAVLTTGGVLLAGTAALSIVPTSLVGALLGYLGASFVVEWLWDRRARLGLADYGLVVGAGVAVVVLGFLPAIGIGTIVAILLFVVRYSRIDAVRHSYTLRIFRSSIERSPFQAAILEDEGDCAVVLEVHGFLFFGTAHSVFADSRILDVTGRLRYAIFDIARVTGIDSSASMALGKLTRRAAAEDFEVILAGSPQITDQLTSQLTERDGMPQRFPTLDEAVEWCEDEILSCHGSPVGHADGAPLAALIGSEEVSDDLLSLFDRIELGDGDHVIQHGEPSPGLFLIESGTLTARLETAKGEAVRLRTMLPGTLIGEISLYLGGPATADVVADGRAVVLHLSSARLAEIEKSDPSTAAAIHRLASHTLAGRVIHAERALRTFRK
jgi:SulP family sulfate permease